MKNIITTIAMFILVFNAKAQVIKFEFDTIQYFELQKGKTIKENIDQKLINYIGFGYGRVDKCELNLDKNFGVLNGDTVLITEVNFNQDGIKLKYEDQIEHNKYTLLFNMDFNKERNYVLYYKEDNMSGGIAYIK
jgi:hypothetical protein